jgi:hypothetical protein
MTQSSASQITVCMTICVPEAGLPKVLLFLSFRSDHATKSNKESRVGRAAESMRCRWRSQTTLHRVPAGSDEAVPASRAWRGTRVALHRPHRSLWVCKSSGAFIWIVLLAAFIRNSERASMYVQWTRSIYNSRSYHHRYHVSPCMHGPVIVIPCFLLQCQFCGLKVLLCS